MDKRVEAHIVNLFVGHDVEHGPDCWCEPDVQLYTNPNGVGFRIIRHKDEYPFPHRYILSDREEQLDWVTRLLETSFDGDEFLVPRVGLGTLKEKAEELLSQFGVNAPPAGDEIEFDPEAELEGVEFEPEFEVDLEGDEEDFKRDMDSMTKEDADELLEDEEE